MRSFIKSFTWRGTILSFYSVKLFVSKSCQNYFKCLLAPHQGPSKLQEEVPSTTEDGSVKRSRRHSSDASQEEKRKKAKVSSVSSGSICEDEEESEHEFSEEFSVQVFEDASDWAKAMIEYLKQLTLKMSSSNKSQHSAQKVCTMDTRPSECRNRRAQCPVVRTAVLRISSLQSDHEMCVKDKKSERENLSSNPSMEIKTLVPPPVSLLYNRPLLLPNLEPKLLPPSNQKALKPQLNINKLTLAVWPLSGNVSLYTKFLRVCPKSYPPHGAQEQNLSINPVA